MKFQDIGNFQLLVCCHQLQVIVGFRVAERLVDIAKRFSLNGQAVFNHNFRFGFRQRVAFQCVTGIGQADPVIFPERSQRFCREWAKRIQLFLELITLLQLIHHLVLLISVYSIDGVNIPLME